MSPARWHPVLYRLSVARLRLMRHVAQRLGGHAPARTKQEALEFRVFKHTSKLIRVAPGVDLALQHGKVQNLRVAIPFISNVVLRPGETFSFYDLVGEPTRARGFVEGVELRDGVPQPGVGGGLCQLANMLHWLVLHSPLTVVERHHHSLDPFPDSGRVVPFGSGATLFYNYLDFRFRNDTDTTFQVRLWLTDKLLEGELRSSRKWPEKFHVFERNHRFMREGTEVFRENELWREVRRAGVLEHEERLFKHRARVLYPVPLSATEPASRPAAAPHQSPRLEPALAHGR
ncbi:MAG: VanW family protein [Myxococcaceae bacterium]